MTTASPPLSSSAPPATPRAVFDWFSAAAALAVIGIYVRAIYFTPIERLQGAAQKIYYLHVPAALSAYIAIGITALIKIEGY